MSCSVEHESAASMVLTKARPLAAPSPTRTEFMAEKASSLRRILEKIPDDAEQALRILGDSGEPRSLAWRCSGCGHIKHFTRPVSVEVAPPCPKCGGQSFQTC